MTLKSLKLKKTLLTKWLPGLRKAKGTTVMIKIVISAWTQTKLTNLPST